MLNYDLLRVELEKTEYHGLSDLDAAAMLRAQTITTHRDVPTADAREILLTAGVWPKIVMTAEPGSGAPPELRGLCILVRDTLTLTETLRITDPDRFAAITTALSRLVAAEIVPQAVADALLALRSQTVAVWQPAPTEHDVAHARSLPNG